MNHERLIEQLKFSWSKLRNLNQRINGFSLRN